MTARLPAAGSMRKVNAKSPSPDSASWDEPLNPLCLLDLAEITGGELSLASMPPRDGELLLIRRIVLEPAIIQPGDVLWCLAERPCDAELAFLRGAAGVVTASPGNRPWPGCFCLVVDTRPFGQDRKSTRLNSSHLGISYAVFC